MVETEDFLILVDGVGYNRSFYAQSQNRVAPQPLRVKIDITQGKGNILSIHFKFINKLTAHPMQCSNEYSIVAKVEETDFTLHMLCLLKLT